MKLKLFIILCFNLFVLNARNNCLTNSHCCTLPDFVTDPTVPISQKPACDIFNEVVCITSPKNGQVFLTDGCAAACSVCTCANGMSCQQAVLKFLTVHGTTHKPGQVVVVTVANIKISGTNTYSRTTVSQLAPGGYGKWSVTFENIPTGRLISQGQPLPTIVSAIVCQNIVTNAIFIKKQKNCAVDCDLVCPPNLGIVTF